MKTIYEQLKTFMIFSVITVICLTISFFLISPGVSSANTEQVANFSSEIVCSPLQTVLHLKEKHFCIDVMKTADETSRGLMFVEKMPDNYGMLFDFSREQSVAMWMKNTPLPLDMIFFDKSKCVNFVFKHAEPYSEEIIRSPFPAQYVLEVNSGIVDKYEIQPGSCF